jgi:hypothetical protein
MVGMGPDHQPPATNTDHDRVSERSTSTRCTKPTIGRTMDQTTKVTLANALVADDDIVFEPGRTRDLPLSMLCEF